MKIRFISFLLFIFLLNCAKIQLHKWPVIVTEIPNWTIWGGNIARTHVYPKKLQLPLELKKHFKTSAAVGKSLLVEDGLLFYTTMDGNIYVYDILHDEEKGHTNVEFHSTLAVKDTVLIIARRYGDDTLFGFNLNAGEIFWHINAGDIDSEPLLFGNEIIITALYKHIDKYDVMSGERIWKTDLQEHIHSSPAMSHNLIFFGCDDNFIYAVDQQDGKVIWKYRTDGAVIGSGAVLDTAFFIGSTDNFFYALNVKNGKLLWRFKTGGQILTGPAVLDSFVVFGSNDEKLYCLNSRTGRLRWQFKAESIISTSPLISENTVFFGSLDHHIYAVNLRTGEEIWKYKTKGRIRTDPVIWGDYLICASEDRDIYIFQSKN